MNNWPVDNIPENHDPHVAAWIKQYVGKNDVFYDIGANRGIFSLQAAEQGAVVYAFEPVPSTAAMIPYHPNITVVACAVGSEPWPYKVALSVGSGQVELTSKDIGREILTRKLIVATLPLDLLVVTCKPPTVIKMDIQGMEYAALCGGTEGALDDVHHMIIEIEAGCLARHGVQESQIYNLCRDIGFAQAGDAKHDVIFERVHA